MFLKDFLDTAETHFFAGFRVDFYVFTDRPNEVPKVNMAAGRTVNRAVSNRSGVSVLPDDSASSSHR